MKKAYISTVRSIEKCSRPPPSLFDRGFEIPFPCAPRSWIGTGGYMISEANKDVMIIYTYILFGYVYTL